MQTIYKIKSDKYPPQLLEIPEPPKFLYVEGELPEVNADVKYLVVVGSRKYTSYGKQACEKLIEGLRGYPIIIVSGLALGIDTIAHKTAIENNLMTIAFPGSGIARKNLYPRANANFAETIINSGGALVSEYEPESKSENYMFPRRNRLMAGIADAVLVIEAEEKSGTSITARLATDYNRTLLAVPGSIFSTTSQGTNRLIKNGATPINNSLDILEALGYDMTEENNRNKSLFEELYIDASPTEKVILELLNEPLTRDELVIESDLSAQEINSALSLMEIKGYVKEELGKMWRV